MKPRHAAVRITGHRPVTVVFDESQPPPHIITVMEREKAWVRDGIKGGRR